MLTKALFFILAALVVADLNHVVFKRCTDVDPHQCAVHRVSVDPCRHGPNFCTINQDKFYYINVNFTTAFSAEDLKLGMFSDMGETGSFTSVRTYKDACRSILTCPIEAHIRHAFDIGLTLSKNHNGKFPLKVKLWNANDETQACCFTFKVKVK